MKKWIVGMGIAVLFVVVVFGFQSFSKPSQEESGAIIPLSTVSGEDVPVSESVPEDAVIEIPLSDISETATFYTYEFSGKIIRFFAVKAGDGTIKTGFDACDVCYREKKGYMQDGEIMVCRTCGLTYPVAGLGMKNKNRGGCWPGYLPSFVEDGNLIIKKSDIENGMWRFV